MSIALCEVTSKLNEPATKLRGDYSQRIKRAIQYARKVPGVAKGDRNPAGYKLVTAIREKFDIADSDMLGVLRDWNSCNTPPLDDNELAELIPNANKYAKKPAGSGYEPIESGKKKQASKKQKPGRRIQRRCFSNITPCEIEYIVPEILPKGVLVSLISQEGVGKSTEASHIAAIVSTGRDWPNSFDTTMQRPSWYERFAVATRPCKVSCADCRCCCSGWRALACLRLRCSRYASGRPKSACDLL